MPTRIHWIHYLTLVAVFLVGLLGFWYFSANRWLRFLIIAAAILFYVSWGIIHHYLERRLNRSIALEYLLLALVILGALSSLARL